MAYAEENCNAALAFMPGRSLLRLLPVVLTRRAQQQCDDDTYRRRFDNLARSVRSIAREEKAGELAGKTG
jgi:hypothetical protein